MSSHLVSHWKRDLGVGDVLGLNEVWTLLLWKGSDLELCEHHTGTHRVSNRLESIGGIASGKFEKDFRASWVEIDELGDVVDIISNNNPTVVFSTVHGDFGAGEDGIRHDLFFE